MKEECKGRIRCWIKDFFHAIIVMFRFLFIFIQIYVPFTIISAHVSTYGLIWENTEKHRVLPQAELTGLTYAPGGARNVYTKHSGEMIDLFKSGYEISTLKIRLRGHFYSSFVH